MRNCVRKQHIPAGCCTTHQGDAGQPDRSFHCVYCVHDAADTHQPPMLFSLTNRKRAELWWLLWLAPAGGGGLQFVRGAHQPAQQSFPCSCAVCGPSLAGPSTGKSIASIADCATFEGSVGACGPLPCHAVLCCEHRGAPARSISDPSGLEKGGGGGGGSRWPCVCVGGGGGLIHQTVTVGPKEGDKSKWLHNPAFSGSPQWGRGGQVAPFWARRGWGGGGGRGDLGCLSPGSRAVRNSGPHRPLKGGFYGEHIISSPNCHTRMPYGLWKGKLKTT